MKKVSKLKLNQFSKDELNQRALNALKGGCNCAIGCGCDESNESTGAFAAYERDPMRLPYYY